MSTPSSTTSHPPGASLLRHCPGLMRMCWPILLSQAALMCNGIADAVMAGHFGTLELAAVGVGGSVWITLFATCFGIINGVAPLIGKQFGAGRPGEVGAYANAAVLVALLLGVLGWAILQFAPTFLYRVTGVAPDVAALAARYVALVAWALPAVLLARVFYAMTTSVNLARPVMVINATVVLIKIPVSYALMHGLFGLPRLGLFGCAIGTVLMFWLMFAGAALYVLRDARYREFRLRQALTWRDGPRAREVLKLGVPIGMSQLLEIGSLAVVALLVGRFGASASAGHQILISLTGVMFMLPLSLGVAVQTFVAQARGRADHGAAREIAGAGMLLAGALGLCACAVLYLLRAPVLQLYSGDAAVVAVGIGLFPLFLCYQFFDNVQCVAASALRGYESTFWPMVVNLVALWGVGVGLGAWLADGGAAALGGFAASFAGLRAFWAAGALGLAACALCLGALLWRHAGARPRQAAPAGELAAA